MGRREQREHIFKLLFMTQFNAEGDMPEQLSLYFESLGELSEKDQETIQEKYDLILEQLEEIDRQAAADSGKKGGGGGSSGDSDPLVPDAVEALLETGQGSTSFLQRRLKVGYARAARIMDELEDRGIVGPQDGAKPRELQITRAQWAEIKERML